MTRFAGALLLVFLLSASLLTGRREFFRSDGLIEYQVAERLYKDGEIDLPLRLAKRDHRVVVGPDGRAFTIYGIGQSLLFVGAMAVDDVLIAQFDPQPDRKIRSRPFFFVMHVNGIVNALTGWVLFLLLSQLGVALGAALSAACLYTLGSIALVYGTLSYDMPLANLGLLVALVGYLRAIDKRSVVAAVVAGFAFSVSLLTRTVSVLFIAPMALHALTVLWRSDLAERRRVVTLALTFLVPVVAAVAFVLWFNDYRFGSPWNFGYGSAHDPYSFDASWRKSVPILLLSPSRGIFMFSPIILLSLFGVRPMLRRVPSAGWLILGTAVFNFFLLAKWGAWDSIASTWGPRFQHLTVLLLAVPLGFACERVLSAPGRLRRIGLLAAGTASIAVQLMVVLVGFSRAKRNRYWHLEHSQLTVVWRRAQEILADPDLDKLAVWWSGHWMELPSLRILAWTLVALTVASGIGVLMCIARHPAGEEARASR